MTDSSYMVISIGNTDNKLSQQEWNLFVTQINETLKYQGHIHFFGGASNWEPWQNVAWIVQVDYIENIKSLNRSLEALRKNYRQDTIFILEGKPSWNNL